MVWCPTGPTSLRLKILENGKTHKQSPGGKCRARIKVGMKVGKKKGNRGIVLTDVPRSQLDLPLHSVALAPRLFYPIIVGNLLLAGDNTKKMQEYFCPVNVYKYFAAVLNSRPAWVKDIIWNDIDPGVLKNCKGLQRLSSVHCHFILSITIRYLLKILQFSWIVE